VGPRTVLWAVKHHAFLNALNIKCSFQTKLNYVCRTQNSNDHDYTLKYITGSESDDVFVYQSFINE